MARNRPAVAFFLLACTAACPKHIDFGSDGRIDDAQALLKLIGAAEAQVYAVKGEAKLKVNSAQAKGAVTVFVAVARPSLLHVESLDFFGRPQAVLVSDGQRFALSDTSSGKFYEGPASARNISQLLPIALPPREMVALMLGQAPRIPAQSAHLEVDESGGAYVLELDAGPVVQTLWVEPRLHRVLKSQVRGVNAYDVSFADIQEESGVTFPRSLTLEARVNDSTVELRYTDYTLNESPDLTMYQLEPPAGAAIVAVDEEGRAVADGGTP
jgi:hypothetical protein